MASKRLCAVFVFSLVFSRPALGQDTSPAAPGEQIELSAAQLEELKKWLKDDEKYQKWYKTYGNKVLHKVKHRDAPPPPDWLEAACRDLIGGEGAIIKACTRLEVLRDGLAVVKARETIATKRQDKEALVKKSFIEKIHLGGGWPIVSDLSQVKYGALLETHVSVVGIGRLELNLPGIMFLSLPDINHKRIFRQAVHWGVSFEMKTVSFPGAKQKFLLHLNLSNAKVLNGWTAFAPEQNTLSLVGLSFTVKK